MIPKILVFACVCVLLPFVLGGESDAEANTFFDVEPRSASAACTTEGCNRFCRRVTLGQGHGVCIGNWCRCINKKARSADEPVLENNQAEEIEVSENAPQNDEASPDSQSNVSTFADVIKSRSARSTCGYDSCNRFCRKLGHARGVCIGNLCQCRFRRRRSTDDADDLHVIKTRSVRATCGTNEECTRSCEFHKLVKGKAYGVCIGNRCQCRFRRTRSAVDVPDVSSGSFADVILSRSRRSCGADECNAHCKKLGHARGVCIGTYCQCRSRLRRSLEDVQDNAKEDDIYVDEKSPATDEDQSDVSGGNFADVILSRSRRSCGAGECNAHCKKLGHARGVCIGTYCQCRSRLRRSLEDVQGNTSEDDIQVDEKSHATNEDQSDVSSGTFADVILSRSRRSCGAGECNAHCKKLGHARGVCIGTYCQCRSRLRRSLEDVQDYASEDNIQVDEKSHATNEDQSDVSSGSFADVILSRSRRSCGAGECNAHCKKLGHARGVCIGTYCQCRSRLRRSVAPAGSQNAIAQPQGFPRCVLYLCIRSCQRRGFKNGANCSIRGCQCRP